MSIRESGWYSVSAGRLSFSRASGNSTIWPFKFDGDQLVLEESNGESHRYRRLNDRECPTNPL